MPKNNGIPMPWEIGDIIPFLHNIRTMYMVFIKKRYFRQGRLWEVKLTELLVLQKKYLEVQSFGEKLRTIQENCEIFI